MRRRSVRTRATDVTSAEGGFIEDERFSCYTRNVADPNERVHGIFEQGLISLEAKRRGESIDFVDFGSHPGGLYEAPQLGAAQGSKVQWSPEIGHRAGVDVFSELH